MRSTTFFFLVFANIFLGSPALTHGQRPAEKPNMLLIVGDDIGFGDLGIIGSVTQTPNLDRLAQRGTRFTSLHVSPVCSVTRGMLLTGNNSIEIGLGAFDDALYPPAEGRPGYAAYLTRTTASFPAILTSVLGNQISYPFVPTPRPRSSQRT